MKLSPIGLGACMFVGACQMSTEPLPGPPAFDAVVQGVLVVDKDLGRVQLSVIDLRAVADTTQVYPAATTIYAFDYTKVFQRQNGELKPLSASQIKVGQSISVWVEGELRSDPPQYDCIQIILDVPQ